MTPPCQITQNGGWPPRTSDQSRKSPTGCAIPIPSRTASPHLQVRHTPGCKQDTLCPSFRCRSPVPLGVGFQRRGPRPPAFVSFQGGAGGNRNPPAFLFRGPGGYSLFKREYPPWLLVPETGMALYAKGPFSLPQHGNVPLREQAPPVPHGGTFMKYPPSPKISLRFPRYDPSGPEGYPPAGGQTPPPSVPHPPA